MLPAQRLPHLERAGSGRELQADLGGSDDVLQDGKQKESDIHEVVNNRAVS